MGIVTNLTDKHQTCIDACNRCAQACEECTMLCLNEPDVAARKNCISGLIECSAICKESACFMAMNAQHAKDLCKLCATVCEKCAAECGMFKDDHCVKCAFECKSCASECKTMAQ
ncbi:putative cysteine-rich protein YhjQ [bioreactor metagenome]|uniref:Putative cysteine-rich protein YhjQ n=1 Tax=bioreactor metagenome TaxID=1076179 RepID=A0A644WL87_9ZZZZ